MRGAYNTKLHCDFHPSDWRKLVKRVHLIRRRRTAPLAMRRTHCENNPFYVSLNNNTRRK